MLEKFIQQNTPVIKLATFPKFIEKFNILHFALHILRNLKSLCAFEVLYGR